MDKYSLSVSPPNEAVASNKNPRKCLVKSSDLSNESNHLLYSYYNEGANPTLFPKTSSYTNHILEPLLNDHLGYSNCHEGEFDRVKKTESISFKSQLSNAEQSSESVHTVESTPNSEISASDPKGYQKLFLHSPRPQYYINNSTLPIEQTSIASCTTAGYLDSKTQSRSNFHFPQRQRQFLIFLIYNGLCERRYVHTGELLKTILCHNLDHSLQDRSGSVKLRDLRQICFESIGSRTASIEMRRNCILFNLIFVRCIIMHEKLILLPQYLRKFDTDFKENDFEAIDKEISSYSMVRRLMDISQSKKQFEIAVLEVLLIETCSYLSDDLIPIKKTAEKLNCTSIKQLSSTRYFKAISDLKREVDVLTDLVKNIRNAIQELLDNEQGLRRLQLSQFWHKQDDWDDSSGCSSVEDAEIMLECYEQEIESMQRHINRIDENLDDAVQIIQLNLASIRNTFLKSELGLNIIGTVVTFVGAIAGIFGMNLANGYETNSKIFWPMLNGMIAICISTAVVTIIMFRKLEL